MRPKSRILPAVLLLVLAAACTAPQAPGASARSLAGLHDAMQRYVDDGRLAGAVALVARQGEIVFHEAVGYRDLESRSPMTTETIFRIASQSKALISVAAMILQEEGRLRLSDPVGKYMPEFLETTVAVAGEDGAYEIVPAERPITVLDLLTHTTGVGYGGGPGEELWAAADIQGWYFADRDEPIGATVSRMAKLPFNAQPGTEFHYGYSTDILGALVEKISGETLDAYLRERILEPLGMSDTHFYLPQSKRDRLATVYSSAGGGLERAPDTGGMVGQGAYVDGPCASFSGGAGLLSTARDYGLFLQMLANGGKLGDARILSAETVALMTVPHFDKLPWAEGTGFGLGFAVTIDADARGRPGSVGEYGWGGAYHSTYWVDPAEELIVVYLAQLSPAGEIDDFATLRAGIYEWIAASDAR